MEKSKVEIGRVRVARGCHFTWGGGIREGIAMKTFELGSEGTHHVDIWERCSKQR